MAGSRKSERKKANLKGREKSGVLYGYCPMEEEN